MKKNITLLLLSMASVASYSQHYVAEFEGGMKIGFDIVDSTVDKMNHFRTGLFASYPNRSIGFLDFNYLAPNTGMAEAEIGIMGNVGVEGFLFFNKKPRMVQVGVPLKEQRTGYNTTTVYRIKTNEQRENTFALHGGIFRRDILDCPSVSWLYDGSTTQNGSPPITTAPPMFLEMAIGITFVQIHDLKLVCHDNSKTNGGVRVRQRQKLFCAGADLLFYPTAGNTQSIIDTAGTNAGSPTNWFTYIQPHTYPPIGARLYLKGYGPGWGKVDWGYFYTLAVEESPCGPAYMAGLGLYIGY